MSQKKSTNIHISGKNVSRIGDFFSTCPFIVLAGAIIYRIIGKPNRSVQKISQDTANCIRKKKPWILG